jgi:hypothetical protein
MPSSNLTVSLSDEQINRIEASTKRYMDETVRKWAVEFWYSVFIHLNPAVTKDDIETVFEQLLETKPTEG